MRVSFLNHSIIQLLRGLIYCYLKSGDVFLQPFTHMTLAGNDDIMLVGEDEALLVENDDGCLQLLQKNDRAAWQYLIRIYFPVSGIITGRKG